MGRLSLITILLAATVGCGCEDSVPVYPHGDAGNGAIAVVGDLQRAGLLESVTGRQRNDEARTKVIAAMAASRPSLVVLLGDLVFDGSSRGEWATFDRFLGPVRKLGVPVLPAPGNHEYWGENRAALANVHGRFPFLKKSHWYYRKHGRLGLIWLDSNQESLGPAAWKAQLGWFRHTLRAADADPAVAGVFVFLHHPPFTNSTLTDDEEHVQDTFVKPLLASPKALAVVSGHVHGYEHFIHGNKHFLVSGGGGGPRVIHFTGDEQRHQDLYRGPTPRPFHFLLITHDRGAARIVARGFDTGRSKLRQIDRIDLPFP